MSNSEPYCELKKFIFDAKDKVRNPYRKEDGYTPIVLIINYIPGLTNSGG